MRLNRFLASAGLGSRRACDDLIRDGRVFINGKAVENLATFVSPADNVRVGRRVVRPKSHTYVLLNKPAGYVCTRSDELKRKNIFDLLPDDIGRLFHVGRLDKESEGLIVLTNDGDLSQELTHPSHQVEKEYDVLLDKSFDPTLIDKLLKGVFIEGGRAKMESIRVINPTKLTVILRQGLKRQIREMLWATGEYRVKRLTRTRIGQLSDPKLKTGHWRPLRRPEIEALGKNPTRHRATKAEK
jgi:23S rRNA pseudouridine2605 synthase